MVCDSYYDMAMAVIQVLGNLKNRNMNFPTKQSGEHPYRLV